MILDAFRKVVSGVLFELDHLLNQVIPVDENHMTYLILPNLLRHDLFEIYKCHLGPFTAKILS